MKTSLKLIPAPTLLLEVEGAGNASAEAPKAEAPVAELSAVAIKQAQESSAAVKAPAKPEPAPAPAKPTVPVLGAVYAPALDRLYYTGADGAYRQDGAGPAPRMPAPSSHAASHPM